MRLWALIEVARGSFVNQVIVIVTRHFAMFPGSLTRWAVVCVLKDVL